MLLEDVCFIDYHCLSSSHGTIQIPKFLYDAFDVVRSNVASVGIFRKGGSSMRQRQMQQSGCYVKGLPQHGAAAEVSLNVYDVANLIKQFFSQLDHPVIEELVQEQFQKAALHRDDELAVKEICAYFHCLDVHIRDVLIFTCLSLKEVASHSEKNLMTEENLGLMFAPQIFRKLRKRHPFHSVHSHQQKVDPEVVRAQLELQVRAMFLMIRNAERLGVMSDAEKIMCPGDRSPYDSMDAMDRRKKKNFVVRGLQRLRLSTQAERASPLFCRKGTKKRSRRRSAPHQYGDTPDATDGGMGSGRENANERGMMMMMDSPEQAYAQVKSSFSADELDFLGGSEPDEPWREVVRQSFLITDSPDGIGMDCVDKAGRGDRETGSDYDDVFFAKSLQSPPRVAKRRSPRLAATRDVTPHVHGVAGKENSAVPDVGDAEGPSYCLRSHEKLPSKDSSQDHAVDKRTIPPHCHMEDIRPEEPTVRFRKVATVSIPPDSLESSQSDSRICRSHPTALLGASVARRSTRGTPAERRSTRGTPIGVVARSRVRKSATPRSSSARKSSLRRGKPNAIRVGLLAGRPLRTPMVQRRVLPSSSTSAAGNKRKSRVRMAEISVSSLAPDSPPPAVPNGQRSARRRSSRLVAKIGSTPNSQSSVSCSEAPPAFGHQSSDCERRQFLGSREGGGGTQESGKLVDEETESAPSATGIAVDAGTSVLLSPPECPRLSIFRSTSYKSAQGSPTSGGRRRTTGRKYALRNQSAEELRAYSTKESVLGNRSFSEDAMGSVGVQFGGSTGGSEVKLRPPKDLADPSGSDSLNLRRSSTRKRASARISADLSEIASPEVSPVKAARSKTEASLSAEEPGGSSGAQLDVSDSEFANSDAVKARILSDETPTPTQQQQQLAGISTTRPSVARIFSTQSGNVKGKIERFNRLSAGSKKAHLQGSPTKFGRKSTSASSVAAVQDSVPGSINNSGLSTVSGPVAAELDFSGMSTGLSTASVTSTPAHAPAGPRSSRTMLTRKNNVMEESSNNSSFMGSGWSGNNQDSIMRRHSTRIYFTSSTPKTNSQTVTAAGAAGKPPINPKHGSRAPNGGGLTRRQTIAESSPSAASPGTKARQEYYAKWAKMAGPRRHWKV